MGNKTQRRVKLYLDHDISYRLAMQLRARGYDAVGAWEVGNAELADLAQLEYAAAQSRVLVTCNSQDFVPHYLAWWDSGRHHSGIVTSQQLEFGEMLRRGEPFYSPQYWGLGGRQALLRPFSLPA